MKQTPSIRRRLAMSRADVEARREVNWNTMRERQRKTAAANIQALHDRYVNMTAISPQMDDLRLLSIQDHKLKLRSILKDMNVYQNPWGGIPAY